MKRVDALIIGAGQAGLAMSHELTRLGVEHVVLERGRVAERWRSERWDSLRLLSPNWHARLPGFRYAGADPDGFMTMPEVAEYLETYGRSFRAPVEELTTVVSVQASDCCGYRVLTTHDTWVARAVVIATGQYERAVVPAAARYLSPDIVQIRPNRYRRPTDVPEGGVLVVGASSTGVQLAHELHEAGRAVILAVGSHVRVPRHYRGKDIFWWMDRMGLLRESAADVADIEASRHQPSLQLVGRPDHSTLGLLDLAGRGVRLTGRLSDIQGNRVTFGGDLVATVAAADLKLAGLLQRIDRFIERGACVEIARSDVPPPPPFVPVWPVIAAAESTGEINLKQEQIRSVVWATGLVPDYPWLHVPVLDGLGRIRHVGGVTPSPGLFVLGLTFLRRRNSALIDGVGADAQELAPLVAARAGVRARIA